MLMQYSGGPGGGGSSVPRFCRQCSVSLALDIQPSICIRQWQIIPSLRYSSQFSDSKTLTKNRIILPTHLSL